LNWARDEKHNKTVKGINTRVVVVVRREGKIYVYNAHGGDFVEKTQGVDGDDDPREDVNACFKHNVSNNTRNVMSAIN